MRSPIQGRLVTLARREGKADAEKQRSAPEEDKNPAANGKNPAADEGAAGDEDAAANGKPANEPFWPHLLAAIPNLERDYRDI
jgi:hypothetical protein